MAGDIVLQFESPTDETFFIRFADILRVEKDPKSENGVKFTLNRYLDSEFVVKSADRKRLMSELKKYWKIFLEEKKDKAVGSSLKDGETPEKRSYLDSIRKIIFKS